MHYYRVVLSSSLVLSTKMFRSIQRSIQRSRRSFRRRQRRRERRGARLGIQQSIQRTRSQRSFQQTRRLSRRPCTSTVNWCGMGGLRGSSSACAKETAIVMPTALARSHASSAVTTRECPAAVLPMVRMRVSAAVTTVSNLRRGRRRVFRPRRWSRRRLCAQHTA